MSEAMRVLIGYDRTTSMGVLLDDLERAGLPDHVQATVLTSANLPGLVAEHDPVTEEVKRAEKAEMERAAYDAGEAASRIRTAFPQWEVRSEAREDSPAWALTAKAEEWKAHLIVVAAHDNAGLSRFMGSVSQLVLLQAPCSVRVARARQAEASDNLRVLVATDGSSGAEKAIRAFAARDWPPNTEVRLTCALHPRLTVKMTHLVPPDLNLSRTVSGLERLSVNHTVEALAEELRNDRVDATAYVREGDPKKLLVAEADDWEADCIFMGARGLSPLRRFLIGSVSMAVAARAHCSVEVVR